MRQERVAKSTLLEGSEGGFSVQRMDVTLFQVWPQGSRPFTQYLHLIFILFTALTYSTIPFPSWIPSSAIFLLLVVQ